MYARMAEAEGAPDFGSSVKVQLFGEGHQNLCNLPHSLDIYLINVQTMRKIAQIFVAFSEKLSFIRQEWTHFEISTK